jgi:hypothetical protein
MGSDVWKKNYISYCDSVCKYWIAYGLDGPGIESRQSEIFRISPDRSWGPHNPLYNGYRVFPGGNVRLGSEADPSPPSSAEVKYRVELYLYSP